MMELDKAKCNAQLRKYYEAILEEPMTMMEASVKLKILRANICWYSDYLRENGKAFIVEFRRCNITRHPNVMVLSADPALIPRTNQLLLFDE